MNLFEMHDGMLVVAPEALGIKVFNEIWKRDKKKAKAKALEEFSYIYFFSDMKSDFADIINEEERRIAIVETTMDDQDWFPDEVILEAVELYKQRSSTVTSAMLDDSKTAVAKISKYLKDVDLAAVDDKGKPIHKAADVAKVIGDMNKIVEGVAALEAKVKREQEEESTMKGGRKKSLFEDGL